MLYQLMKDADALFHKHGVMYLVESGTLLGAVRHGGIIPIDDDLDIQIRQEDEAKFVDVLLLPALKALGYGSAKFGFGYKVFPEKGKAMVGNLFKFPFMDVIVVNSDGLRTHAKNGSFKIYHFLLSEIHPVRRYKFGDTEVDGPRDPTGFLDRAYGKDWKTTWLSTHSHAFARICTHFCSSTLQHSDKQWWPLNTCRPNQQDR